MPSSTDSPAPLQVDRVNQHNRFHFMSVMANMAGIKDLQRKDLRKWGTTRLIAHLRDANISELHGMKITGHTTISTYQWYLQTDRETVTRAGEALDKAREK